MLEGPARNKHSSLLGRCISYEENKVLKVSLKITQWSIFVATLEEWLAPLPSNIRINLGVDDSDKHR
jgi:hypothetical protein